MLAVLENAVHDFQHYRLATGRGGKRLFCEAQKWLVSPEETYIFSCVAICQAVGIDPDYLRKGLLAWSPEKRSEGKTEIAITLANAIDPLYSKEAGYNEQRYSQYGTTEIPQESLRNLVAEDRHAVMEAIKVGSLTQIEKLQVRMKLEVDGVNLEFAIENNLALS